VGPWSGVWFLFESNPCIGAPRGSRCKRRSGTSLGTQPRVKSLRLSYTGLCLQTGVTSHGIYERGTLVLDIQLLAGEATRWIMLVEWIRTQHVLSVDFFERTRGSKREEGGGQAQVGVSTLYPRHPRPCTLHPGPCTLDPAPYTLHHLPHTRHRTPHTLHPTPVTPQSTPYTLHPAPCNPQPSTLNTTTYALTPKPNAVIATSFGGALVLCIKPTLSPPIPHTWCDKANSQT
jgi:hypothetical protein